MKKELCRNCMHYSAFYRQRDNGYGQLNYGICSLEKEQHKRFETCSKFKYNELRAQRRKANLYLSLKHAAVSINQIICILKEKEAEK